MKLEINREQVKQAFAQYVRQYNAENEKILLKILHTYRVAEVSEKIADGLGLSSYDTDLAWLIGMLHDIGRFEQLRRYDTFVDAESIDHAHFGVELLFEDGLIRDYVEDWSTGMEKNSGDLDWSDGMEKMPGDLSVIRTAIWNHSSYRIEEGLDERTLLFCKIIRDADKVDIFKVAHDTSIEALYRCTPKEFRNAAVSPEVIQAYREEHAVLRSLKKTSVDFLVGHIALVFELEFLPSCKITWEQGYLQKLLSFQSDLPETAIIFQDMRKQMEEFYQRRMKSV